MTTELIYWVVIDVKNFKTGEPITRRRFGPYPSEQEAEQAKLDFWPPNAKPLPQHAHAVPLKFRVRC